MSNDSPLRDIQRWMLEVISHPDGIAAGVASDAARGAIAADDVEAVVRPSRRLDATSRLGVYGYAYFARLVECLRDEFPTLRQLLGDEAFDGFALAYLQAHPSNAYTLGRLGERFPAWLRDVQPEADLQSDTPTWSHFVVDVARLERMFAEVFDGPGSEGDAPLRPEELASIAPDVWPACRLSPVPCLRLAEFHFPVHEYRTAVKRGETPPPPMAERTRLVVTRREFVVRRVAVGAEEFRLLASLVEGSPVGEAVVSLAESCTWSDDELADRLRRWFREWALAGYFAAVVIP